MSQGESDRAQRHRYRANSWVLVVLLAAVIPVVLPVIAFMTPLGALYFGDSQGAWAGAGFAALIGLAVGQAAWAGAVSTADGVTVRAYLFAYRIPHQHVEAIEVPSGVRGRRNLSKAPAVRINVASGGMCQVPGRSVGGRPWVWAHKIQPRFADGVVVFEPEMDWQGRKRFSPQMRAYRVLQAPHPIAIAAVVWAVYFTAVLRVA